MSRSNKHKVSTGVKLPTSSRSHVRGPSIGGKKKPATPDEEQKRDPVPPASDDGMMSKIKMDITTYLMVGVVGVVAYNLFMK